MSMHFTEAHIQKAEAHIQKAMSSREAYEEMARKEAAVWPRPQDYVVPTPDELRREQVQMLARIIYEMHKRQ